MATRTTTDLHYLDATAAKGLFRSGDLSPVELLRAVLERTDALNPQVNALTEHLVDAALVDAERAERRYRAGGELPALLGIPIATKEKHALAGHTVSNGLVAHRNAIASSDHPVVDRIRRAGGIIHARTTTPEFSCATVTHSPLWGVTRNPWNAALSPGGSSGGSGAALAAGFAPLATGSDIAGSTRLPAAFTGTVGYKAPYGRVPGAPPLSADHYRGDGPMARTVADAAMLANVMAGPHPDDHSSVSRSPRLPGEWPSVAGLRLALCIRLGDYIVDPDVERNARAVADALRSAGAIVEEVELPWTTAEIHQTAFTHFGHILGPSMEDEAAGGEHLLAPYTRQFMDDARVAASGNRYLDGLRAESRMQGELARIMSGFAALICPTSAVASLAADGDYPDGLSIGAGRLRHYWEGHMTLPFNIANRCPVLAVPSGMAACGIPTGVQIVGHPFDDDMVFRVGSGVEATSPWAQRFAQISS
jgi:aspartyl-tRNA(Asn)/glutamyl-tRNA(Gln) amidotransferase subunit A